MRVALVHDFLNTWGGGEQVLKVFTEMFPEAPIFTISYKPEIIDEFLSGVKVIPSFLQTRPGMPDRYKYYLASMPKAVESFDLSQFDLVLSDSSSFAKGALKATGAKHICYLHTPTRYLWSDRDDYIKNAPIPLPIIGRAIIKRMISRLQKWDLIAAQRPDVLIVNSEFIAERTRRYYRRNPDAVVFPPVDAHRFRISTKPKDYFLVVARAEPYKRTNLAIQAANALGFKLKVVGGGTKFDALKKIAGPTVEFVGRVTDEALVDLYADCLAFLFPPLEDAGITPLEAMASGRPVIAYGQGGALESVVAGITGEFFSEQTVESLTTAIKKFDEKKYDPIKIRAHALQFDKAVFKKKISQIIEKTLSKA